MEYYFKSLHYRTIYFNNAYYRYFRSFLQGKCVSIQQLVYKVIQTVSLLAYDLLFI